MELIAFDVEGFHLGGADPDALFIGASVESAFDFQAGLGGRRGDQLDDGSVQLDSDRGARARCVPDHGAGD